MRDRHTDDGEMIIICRNSYTADKRKVMDVTALPDAKKLKEVTQSTVLKYHQIKQYLHAAYDSRNTDDNKGITNNENWIKNEAVFVH